MRISKGSHFKPPLHLSLSLYLYVAQFMEAVRHTLHQKHPALDVKVDHEVRVLRFASEVALVIVACTRQKGLDVLFSLEYKPKVAQDLGDQHACNISEMFLQAFYVETQVEHDVLHCLTDLNDYHLFLMGKKDGKFCIKAYWYRACNLDGQPSSFCTSPSSFREHTCADVTRPDTDVGR